MNDGLFLLVQHLDQPPPVASPGPSASGVFRLSVVHGWKPKTYQVGGADLVTSAGACLREVGSANRFEAADYNAAVRSFLATH